MFIYLHARTRAHTHRWRVWWWRTLRRWLKGERSWKTLENEQVLTLYTSLPSTHPRLGFSLSAVLLLLLVVLLWLCALLHVASSTVNVTWLHLPISKPRGCHPHVAQYIHVHCIRSWDWGVLYDLESQMPWAVVCVCKALVMLNPWAYNIYTL